MQKIFLSHSSNDKAFVRPISNYFGGDVAIFDEATFEGGMQTLEEIFRNLDRTDIFIYFISESSLTSPWVIQEINQAEQLLNNNTHKLVQIFPIIIDSNITYDDSRIPDYLKTGFGAYNLRYMDNYKIAIKKIENQVNYLALDSDLTAADRMTFFYGREIEIVKFKNAYEERNFQGKKRNIKCMFLSGIDGIGRKSLFTGTLKNMRLMPLHHFPMTLSLERTEGINDLIIKISDLGFGDYTIPTLAPISAMEEKTEILSNLLKKVQEANEYIIIEDNQCIVNSFGGISFWFLDALDSLGNQIVLGVVSQISVDKYNRHHNDFIYTDQISELSTADTIGFLRKYSDIKKVPFSEDNIDSVREILVGYPPQIKYTVDYACDNGIASIKSGTHNILEYSSFNSTKMLAMAAEGEEIHKFNSILAVLAKFGSTSSSILSKIYETDKDYKKIVGRLTRFSICTTSGSSGELLKLNSTIRDYVQRTKNIYVVSAKLKKILSDNVNDFLDEINNPNIIDYLDFSEIVYYIKEGFKDGQIIPDKYLYDTIYVQSINELFNEEKYREVINMFEALSEAGHLEYLEESVESSLYYYYCSSLARKRSPKFNSEVEYFNEKRDYQRYDFLKGYSARISGHYGDAEFLLKRVLSRNSDHNRASRELVHVYIMLEQYDDAFDLARINYRRFPENIYHIQAYFDILVRRTELSSDDLEEVEKMIVFIRRLNRQSPTALFYQLESKYSEFILSDRIKAEEYLEEGLKEYTNTFYLVRDLFDLHRREDNLDGMSKAFSIMDAIAKSGETNYGTALLYRECILQKATGVKNDIIKLKISGTKLFSESMKARLIQNIDSY